MRNDKSKLEKEGLTAVDRKRLRVCWAELLEWLVSPPFKWEPFSSFPLAIRPNSSQVC